MTSTPLHLRDLLAAALEGGSPVALTSRPLKAIPENGALLIESGGSTGEPKIVALSAYAMRESASRSNQALGAEQGDRWGLSLPLNHIAGINQLLRSIDLGSNPVTEAAEFISVVPTQLYRALESRDHFFHQLIEAKKVLVGGAMIPTPLLNRGRDLGIPLVTSYGMTEMCGGCIYDGKALPGVEIVIRDSGKIALKGPMQAIGYVDNDCANSESFIEGWFVTNDFGLLSEIEDGVLHVIGRADDVIISGGEKISPQKVATILQNHFPHFEIHVISMPDIEWGQTLRVVIATGTTTSSSVTTPALTLENLRNIVTVKLGKVAAPRSLLLLSEIPIKANGKLDLVTLTAAKATEKY